MSDNDVSFVDAYLAGKASLDDVDDWVSRWHIDDSIDADLHVYLGMTWDEYRAWVQDPHALDAIIERRHTNQRR